MASRLNFEGIVALASNKNPFTQQQREGIIDRRMIYIPFTNRVPRKQKRMKFDMLFPQEELEKFVSFAVKQDPTNILEFISDVNQDVNIRQVMLESFKDNEESLHLQNFIQNALNFSKSSWVPRGSPEDTRSGESLYSAYLEYVHTKGVNSNKILNYINFKQEFLPLIETVYPEWDIYERRRKYLGRKVYGILNVEIKPPSNSSLNFEESFLNLQVLRKESWWFSPEKKDDPEETLEDQNDDSDPIRDMVPEDNQEDPVPEGGHTADSVDMSGHTADTTPCPGDTPRKKLIN
uniref:Uncharacterized protein n=1 Tax=Caulerpa verticillata TaxID=177082 RepID=A0A386B063_9CHLO|nr:hypothetical protein [Caulerpa verticillata]AYC65081.1 hypothetical protein [Caulerpa verticillata]